MDRGCHCSGSGLSFNISVIILKPKEVMPSTVQSVPMWSSSAEWTKKTFHIKGVRENEEDADLYTAAGCARVVGLWVCCNACGNRTGRLCEWRRRESLWRQIQTRQRDFPL